MSHAAVLVALDGVSGRKTTKTIESLVEWEMAPFDENQQCFRNGSRWDWWQIGGRYSGGLLGENARNRSELDLDKFTEFFKEEGKKTWAESLSSTYPPDMRQIIFGIKPTDTEEEFVRRQCHPAWFAFLKNRHWHESERLGWFGGTAKTECEIATGDEPKGKCLHRDKKTGAKIIVWNEPHEKWKEKFWDRFIKPLKPDTLLVVVDYHV